jgi:hypothetical protein
LAQRVFSSSAQEIADLDVSVQQAMEHSKADENKAIEPRFLENVQLMVDNAASKAQIQPDMLKYIMACDNVVRF